MTTKQVETKDDPFYIFKIPIEELTFYGATDQERIGNALIFSRLRSLIQRFGPQMTPDEFDTLKTCMETCINESP